MPVVTLDDFVRSFAASPEEFSNTCRRAIQDCDFRYERLDTKSRDEVILCVLKKIAADTQVIGTPERTGVWENGWAENLHAFVAGNYNLDALIPKFIRENQPIRYDGDYIMPTNPRFEYDHDRVPHLALSEIFLQVPDYI